MLLFIQCCFELILCLLTSLHLNKTLPHKPFHKSMDLMYLVVIMRKYFKGWAFWFYSCDDVRTLLVLWLGPGDLLSSGTSGTLMFCVYECDIETPHQPKPCCFIGLPVASDRVEEVEMVAPPSLTMCSLSLLHTS